MIIPEEIIIEHLEGLKKIKQSIIDKRTMLRFNKITSQRTRTLDHYIKTLEFVLGKRRKVSSSFELEWEEWEKIHNESL